MALGHIAFAIVLVTSLLDTVLASSNALAQTVPRERKDTVTFVSLGPPPTQNSSALAAWLRVGRRLFGTDTLTIIAAPGVTARVTALRAAAKRLKLNNGGRDVTKALEEATAISVSGRRTTDVVPNIPSDVSAQSQPRPLSQNEEAEARRDLALAGVDESSKFVTATFGERPIRKSDLDNDGFKEGYIRDIRNAVRGSTPRRRAILVILDSGWPTALAKEKSFKFLDELARVARATYGVQVALGAAPVPSPWAPPEHDHVTFVAAALDSLVRMPNDSLSIFYFPLAIPAGDKDALRHFILTDWLIQYQINRLVGKSGGACSLLTPEERIRCYQKSPLTAMPDSLQRAVEAIVRRAVAPKSTASFASGLEMTVDIYNAIWTLLEVWSATTKSTAFINASWTALSDARYMPAKESLGGSVLTIGAAGNTDSVVRRGFMTDFAQRAFERDGFLLIENRGLNGNLMCYSTLLDPRATQAAARQAYLFGLVRKPDGSTSCGTSFAAPRVAWILAYAETLRSGECQDADTERRHLAMKNARPREIWPIVYLNSVAGRSKLRVSPGCD